MLLASLALGGPGSLRAEPIPRPEPVVGSIVAARGRSELLPIELQSWRQAEVEQALRTADRLRTGPDGGLAVVFADRTQIRVHRNTELGVTALPVGDAGTAKLDLRRGLLWARAARGDTDVEVRTPSATAAIRGTDWSLQVDDSGATTLVVLDGVVRLANAQGAVDVARGEVGRAEIGRAPSKSVIVRFDERPQQILFLDLPSALGSVALRPRDAGPPATEGTAAALDRAELLIDASRWTEVPGALAAVPDDPADPTDRARRRLLEAAVAAHERRHALAAQKFAEAIPGLDPQRRAIALAGRYLSLLLAREPADAALAELRGDPAAALRAAQVDIVLAAFTGDVAEARRLGDAAIARFPDEPELWSLQADILALAGDGDALGKLTAEAIRRFPDDPAVWGSYGDWQASVQGDPEAALAAYERGLALRPDDPDLLNQAALALSSIGETSAALARIDRGLAQAPRDAALRANRALVLLDQERLGAAAAEIATLRALAPDIASTHSAASRLALQAGDIAMADREALIAQTLDPSQTDPSLLAAAAALADEDFDRARQAIDAARRADPHDTAASIAGAQLARDLDDADRSMRLAREAIARARVGGRPLDTRIAGGRDGSTSLGAAFDFLDLGAWARFQGDRFFDPFDSGSQLFSAATSTSAARVRSGLLQGLLLDPLAASSRLRYGDFLRRPFVDVGLSGSVAAGGKGGERDSGLQIEAFGRPGAPVAISLVGSLQDADGDRDGSDADGGALQLLTGLRPTPETGVVAQVNLGRARQGFLDQGFDGEALDETSRRTDASASLGASYRLGARNVLMAQLRGSTDEQLVDEAIVDRQLLQVRNDGAALELRQLVGLGDLTLSWGATAGTATTDLDLEGGALRASSETLRLGGHVDLRWQPEPDLVVQAGIVPSVQRVDGATDDPRLGPRFGIGLSPADGHWLRVGYREDLAALAGASLAPVDLVGLDDDTDLLAADGRARTVEARWDAEWSDRVFTSIAYVRSELDSVSISLPETLLQTLDLPQVTQERFEAAVNVWLDGGFGLFGELTLRDTTIDQGPLEGLDVPLLPRRLGRVGVTWVSPAALRATLALRWEAGAPADLANSRDLEASWPLDLTLRWEPLRKHLSLNAGILDLLDDSAERADGLEGLGRRFLVGATVRF